MSRSAATTTRAPCPPGPPFWPPAASGITAGARQLRSFWASGTGWGTFAVNAGRTTLRLDHGMLKCRSCAVRAAGTAAKVAVGGKAVSHKIERGVVTFNEPLVLRENDELVI